MTCGVGLAPGVGGSNRHATVLMRTAVMAAARATTGAGRRWRSGMEVAHCYSIIGRRNGHHLTTTGRFCTTTPRSASALIQSMRLITAAGRRLAKDRNPMTRPNFYDPQRVGTMYRPDVAHVVNAGTAAGVPPAADDERRVLLVLVDTQVDFIHEDGTLSVPGAVEDTRRTVEWLYDHLGEITTVAASFDTHSPMQIFYP